MLNPRSKKVLPTISFHDNIMALTVIVRSSYASGPTMVSSNSTSTPCGVAKLDFCVVS
jgi:hypothetical protein